MIERKSVADSTASSGGQFEAIKQPVAFTLVLARGAEERRPKDLGAFVVAQNSNSFVSTIHTASSGRAFP
jgi:hypothetical protein